MQLKITINLDNDAFAGSWEDEAARILEQVVTNLRNGTQGHKLLDINGNTVGKVTVTGKQPTHA